MTFKHKLSCRLALLKDRVVLASLAVLVTAAIVACELPVRVTDAGSTIANLLVSPKTLTLRQNATTDFTAVAFMSTGDSANDLAGIVLDPNVHIQEVKALSCDIRPGRRPRGPALVEFVDGLRAQALAEGSGAPTQEPAAVRGT